MPKEDSVFDEGSLKQDFGSLMKVHFKEEENYEEEISKVVHACVVDLRPSIDVPPKLELKALT